MLRLVGVVEAKVTARAAPGKAPLAIAPVLVCLERRQLSPDIVPEAAHQLQSLQLGRSRVGKEMMAE